MEKDLAKILPHDKPMILIDELLEVNLEKFENGKTYTITAKEIYSADELVSFECLIYNDDIKAKATINAFQPKNAEEYLKGL